MYLGKPMGEQGCCGGGCCQDATAQGSCGTGGCGCGHEHGAHEHDHPLHLTAEQIEEINAILGDVEDPDNMDKDLTPEQIERLKAIFGLPVEEA